MPIDMLIIVDCKKPVSNGQLSQDAVAMYASDPSIIRNNTQGATELWVQVPPETNLRWRAIPLQLSDDLPEGQQFQVMITQVRLWGANPYNADQLDAYQYLVQWFANAGTNYGPTYSPSSQSFSVSDPRPGGYNESNNAVIERVQINDPYVQATCNGAMTDPSKFVAYSFTCTVYKNGKQYATVSWDPYVTII
jgi:hypothetical protein